MMMKEPGSCRVPIPPLIYSYLCGRLIFNLLQCASQQHSLCVRIKQDTVLLSITLTNVHQFQKLFYQHIE